MSSRVTVKPWWTWVVAFAEQPGVGEAGVAALGPVDEVVDLGPPVRCVAAGEDAGLVAGDDGSAQGRGDQAVGAAQIERFAVRAENEAGEVGVAGGPSCLRRGDRGAEPRRRGGLAGAGVEQILQ